MSGRMRFKILGALAAATGIEFKVIWSEGSEEWERSEMKLGLDADQDSQRPAIRAGVYRPP